MFLQWAKVRDTEGRNGHYIPVSGYRTFNKKDRLVPRGSNTLKDEEFDEARSFACSDVGVLASTIKEDKSYFIFGFQGLALLGLVHFATSATISLLISLPNAIDVSLISKTH